MAPRNLIKKPLAAAAIGTSRVCSGLVGGVAQGCNIRSPAALAWRVDADYPFSVTITCSFDANGVPGRSDGADSCILAVASRSVEARRHRAAQ